MNLKPGCGCLVLLLGILDLALAIRALIAVVAGTAVNTASALTSMAILGGNFAICLAVGWPAIRGRRADQDDSADSEKTRHEAEEGEEGEDADMHDES